MSDGRRYWEHVHEVFPTETMQMTCNDVPADVAEDESARDAAELLELIPPLPRDARIVELAAGFGRFTTRLATRGTVVAYDFVADFCARNRARHLPNVEIRNEDVRTADLPKDVDLVFWSWLLQLVSADEAAAILATVLRMLRPGGILVFRETCATETVFWEGPPATWYYEPAWYQDALARAGFTAVETIALRTWDDQRVFRARPAGNKSF